tara:strand:- start:169 stop:591 length:423 start_codon:yes stop_codon:yes gene_type:complete
MAKRDLKTKPFINDRNDNVFIGLDLPFRKSDGVEGWFASTSDTISAVKVNIKNFLETEQGERLMQPKLGIPLRKYLFEQITDDVIMAIQADISNSLGFWMPFIDIKNIVVNKENNQLNISLVFNIKRNPNMLETVEATIG